MKVTPALMSEYLMASMLREDTDYRKCLRTGRN